MERVEVGQLISQALGAWKKNPEGTPEIANLNSAIKLAMDNSIDLVLKTPYSVLKPGTTRSIFKQDVEKYSAGREGELIIFYIFSDLNRGKSEEDKGLQLKAQDYSGKPTLLMKSSAGEIIGMFFCENVAVLEPK